MLPNPNKFTEHVLADPAAATAAYLAEHSAPQQRRPYYDKVSARKLQSLLEAWIQSGFEPRVLYAERIGISLNSLKTLLHAAKDYIKDHPSEFPEPVVTAATDLHLSKEGIVGYRFSVLGTAGGLASDWLQAFKEPKNPTVSEILSTAAPVTVAATEFQLLERDLVAFLNAGGNDFKRDGLTLTELELSSLQVLLDPHKESYAAMVNPTKVLIVKRSLLNAAP